MGLYDMAWYPKPFGPGDMHSAGETKVLGRPEVNFVNLLVRETAQNSWDARLPSVVPRFELRLRKIDDRARDVLTWNVFGSRVAGSALDRALDAPELTALEVVDRGTKGLGGPTRNGTPRAPGEPNDYSDFILTVGAPPDDPAGGGSYGFGKTASYMASECATIIVWSRSRDADGQAGGALRRVLDGRDLRNGRAQVHRAPVVGGSTRGRGRHRHTCVRPRVGFRRSKARRGRLRAPFRRG